MGTEKRPKTRPPYLAEMRERAVRLGREAERDGRPARSFGSVYLSVKPPFHG
jgi:hypothetical protein